MPGLEKRKAQFFVLEQKGGKCCDQRKTKNAAIFGWMKDNYGVLQGPRDKFRLVGSPLHSPASRRLLGVRPVQIARGLSDCRWNGSRILVTGNQKHQQHHPNEMRLSSGDHREQMLFVHITKEVGGEKAVAAKLRWSKQTSR